MNLFHWDLPQRLQDLGGWPARSTAEAFAEHAEVVGDRLGDRVQDWITHNEPFCSSWLGYGLGVHAPGHREHRRAFAAAHHLLLSHGWATQALRRSSPDAEVGIVVDSWPAWITHNEPFCSSWLGYGLGVHAPGHREHRRAFAAAHHLLLSHGWATQALRRSSPDAEVGIVVDSCPAYPAGDSVEDVRATTMIDGVTNRWFFDALFRRAYPEDVLAEFTADAPPVCPGDLATIATPLDFVGVNNYSRRFVRADPAGGLPVDVRPGTGQLTDMGWEVYPAGLGEVLLRLHRDYGVSSLYVTENGAAFADVRTA